MALQYHKFIQFIHHCSDIWRNTQLLLKIRNDLCDLSANSKGLNRQGRKCTFCADFSGVRFNFLVNIGIIWKHLVHFFEEFLFCKILQNFVWIFPFSIQFKSYPLWPKRSCESNVATVAQCLHWFWLSLFDRETLHIG